MGAHSLEQPGLLRTRLAGQEGGRVCWVGPSVCPASGRTNGQSTAAALLWTHAQTHSLRHSYRDPTQCVPVPPPPVPWLADQFINLKSVFDWLESKRTCMKLATGYEAKLGHSPQVGASRRPVAPRCTQKATAGGLASWAGGMRPVAGLPCANHQASFIKPLSMACTRPGRGSPARRCDPLAAPHSGGADPGS